jgi:hypothetical protein
MSEDADGDGAVIDDLAFHPQNWGGSGAIAFSGAWMYSSC